MANQLPLPREQAELLGIRALGWIAGQPERAGAFLVTAGASADEMRERASDPEFLGFVLDFLLGDEEALLEFCQDENLPLNLHCDKAVGIFQQDLKLDPAMFREQAERQACREFQSTNES